MSGAPRSPKRPIPKGTPAPGDKRMVQIQVWLPEPHLDMLTREAELFGVPRGNFLLMLLRKRRGLVPLERPQQAPQYDFKLKDFEKSARYSWYLSPEDRKMLEADCLEMGDLGVGAWIVTVLNQYVRRAGF
jgi:hypothetical protein